MPLLRQALTQCVNLGLFVADWTPTNLSASSQPRFSSAAAASAACKLKRNASISDCSEASIGVSFF